MRYGWPPYECFSNLMFILWYWKSIELHFEYAQVAGAMKNLPLTEIHTTRAQCHE